MKWAIVVLLVGCAGELAERGAASPSSPLAEEAPPPRAPDLAARDPILDGAPAPEPPPQPMHHHHHGDAQ